jgi:hypothetical protein
LKISEKKAMPWTIVVAKGRLTEDDTTMGYFGGHGPDPIIASRPCNNIHIFTNPSVDILLIDFPFQGPSTSSWLTRTLVLPGFYEPNLMLVKRLAFQFESRFEMACWKCNFLPFCRRNYQEWLETKSKSPERHPPRIAHLTVA